VLLAHQWLKNSPDDKITSYVVIWAWLLRHKGLSTIEMISSTV
jgi:hypothetical protein